MKRKILRSIVVIILLVSILSFSAYAAVIDDGDLIMPMYQGLQASVVTLDIPSSGWAYCYGRMQIISDYSAEIELSLLRKAEGDAFWSSVTTWSDDTYPYEIEEEYYVSSGYTYRLKLSATIYDAKGNAVSYPVEYSDFVEH